MISHIIHICETFLWDLSSNISDPDSLIPDPDQAFWVKYGTVPIRIQVQDFDDQKLEKCTAETKIFWSKIAIYLFLGLHKDVQSYRRNLPPSKENIQHFKTWNLFNFFLFLWVIFTLLDPDRIRFPNPNPDPDPLTLLIPYPIRIRIRNTAF
jgi:hypothetical protein